LSGSLKILNRMYFLMHILELFKKRFHAGTARALTALAAFITAATSFSAAARAQVAQPMYGVPAIPIVKYGLPPITTPNATVIPIVMYGPPPVPTAASQVSVEAAIAVVIAAAIFLVCIWAGLKFFLLNKEK